MNYLPPIELSHFSFLDYCGSGSIEYGFMATLILGTICFILTKITTEYSWVDRIWSILPILYQAHILFHQKSCSNIAVSSRQILMISLTCLWGMRLTYNFYRKGGYRKGGEDYRWKYIRERFHWVLVEVLNLVFTAYYQIVLIFWFSSPIYYSHTAPFSLTDAFLAVLWLLFLSGEILADQQQWAFQNQKSRLLTIHHQLDQLPFPYRNGFITNGLFKFTRHPNFFCEISLWWVMFLFSANSQGINWSGVGALLLNLLFLGSTKLTEKISSEKYKGYEEYKKSTSMLIPFWSGKQKKL